MFELRRSRKPPKNFEVSSFWWLYSCCSEERWSLRGPSYGLTLTACGTGTCCCYFFTEDDLRSATWRQMVGGPTNSCSNF